MRILALLALLAFGALLAVAQPGLSPVPPVLHPAWGISKMRYHMGDYTYCNEIAVFPTRSETDTLRAAEIACSAPANILWPDETATVTVQIVNKTAQPFSAVGHVDCINYALTSSPTDGFMLDIQKLALIGKTPIMVAIGPKGYQDITFTPPIPAKNGGYALILDLPGQERLFLATLVRTFKAQHLGPYYRLTMDNNNLDTLTRLGAACNRIDGGSFCAPDDPQYAANYQRKADELQRFKAADIPVTIEFGADGWDKQPYPGWSSFRGYLKYAKDGKPIWSKSYPGDATWLPQYDPIFKAWVKRLASEYGWPKGPIIGMKFMNEPWEGDSCAGWGADMPRYREVYTALCEGVEEARKEAGVKVMLGGCDSTANTFDKLFPDGKDTFLQRLDFMSIHYQGLDPVSTCKMFVDRKNPLFGRVQIWDTESWCANSDDRVTAVLPSFYAAGYDHVVGVHGGCVVAPESTIRVRTPKGEEPRKIVQAWSVGAAIGALQHFIGNRPFNRILFDGLPFVYQFDGMPAADGTPNAEDGIVVVCGDIGRVFGEDNVLFRTVRCNDDVRVKRALFNQLATLPIGSPERAAAELAFNQRALFTHANLLVDNPKGQFSLYDYYGNPVPNTRGRITIPVNDHGFFLRANGAPGSFAALLDALQHARVEGLQPVEIIAHDPTAPIDTHPTLRLSVHNVLPQPVSGTLTVKLGALSLAYPTKLTLAPHERQEIAVRITGGAPTPTNGYPLNVTFTGKDGTALHAETMHANVIVRKTITVDGNLDDWAGAYPQTISSDGSLKRTLEESAWTPYKPFDTAANKGLATGYLAYDDNNLYFAAKIADDTPDPGTLRFATRDDDAFFYPATVYDADGKAFTWPTGVRRYTYAKTPVLPAGNAPNFDNVQLAFNVVPPADKPWYEYPRGTLPHFVADWCTDYEYSLNTVAPQCGGGTEIWRARYPGMANKHFYPRQPKGPLEGPAQGQLVTRHDGNTRIVECALPWTEIPHVKTALDAGSTIKFSFRVNDNAGVGCLELARYRSVSQQNSNAFRVDWTEHWATEVEFGFAK